MVSQEKRWFLRPLRREHSHLKLFCLPYAGGTPNIFRGWAQSAPDGVEVVGIRLPGRDRRLTEPAFTDWTALLDATAAALEPHLDRPYAFFGHSFGARVALELTKHFEANGQPTPTRLIISGCRCPHVPPPDPELHLVPRDEFFRRVRKMKGTPAEVLENQRIMEMLEPTLRADMGLHNQEWVVSERTTAVPIVALSGARDEIDPPESMRDWGRYTSAEFSFHSFPGEHFFLHSDEAEVLATIWEVLGQAGAG
ncbi:thioesterase II family protein [Haliangium sp.]|uniref:thioesterase II family protein n=1 Tax=Haliangium sp. TaxID=2663208 RepID=UPI003D0E5E78